MTANMIAKKILSQIDSQAHHYQVLKDISDHSVYGSELKWSDGFIRITGRNLHSNKKTRGWKLEIEWKYGILICVSLKDNKVSNPVEPAEYTVSNNIDDEPLFKFWVKNVPRKQDRNISNFKEEHWKK